MRSFTKTILAAVLFALSSGLASAAPTLNVFIKDQAGAPVAGVQVAAIEFGMNGPSTHTQVAVTGADGKIAPLNIEANRSYNLYYTLHGYSPSISDQFNNPEYDPNRYVWATGNEVRYSTFTITSGLANVGRLSQEFTGASTGTVLFGGVYNMLSQMPGGSGIVLTSVVSGSGTLVIDNVPFALANTYNIGLYDPKINRGIGRNVMSDLGDGTADYPGTTVVTYAAASNAGLNFNQAVPPSRVEKTSKPGEEANAGASVEGVLMSTGSATIGHMGIEVKGCGGSYNWQTWAHADENGRFQLYGLTPGVTYYLKIMGGCTWNQDNQESKCYEPYSSPNFEEQNFCSGIDNSLATSKDIVYGVAGSSDVVYKTITLNEMPKSIGQIRVYVKSPSGRAIPNSNVSISQDGSPWPTNYSNTCVDNNFINYISSPGFSNSNVQATTGYALLEGLPSGNYSLYIHTPFSNNSEGPSAPFNGNGDDFTSFGMNGGGGGDWTQAHCSGTGVNDYRITIDTNPVTNGGQTFHIYNSSGNHIQFAAGGNIVSDGSGVNMSSITYIVEAGAINMSGLVKGTLKFPGIAELTSNPITISLNAQCMDMGPGGYCPPGNFFAADGSGASSYDYEINVSSGYSYYMNVSASGWGRINRGGGNNNINLQTSSFSVVNMDFAPAGTITGTVYKPGGTEILTPSNNQWIWIDAGTDNSWTGTQLQKDGTFAMTDVLPGINRISMNVSGGGSGSTFNYTLPQPQPTVVVTEGSETTVNLTLVKSNYVGIVASMTYLPDNTVVLSEDGRNAILGFKVIPLPAGTVLKGDTISKMLTGGDEEGMRISFSPPTGPSGEGRCGNNWPGGFCGTAFPSPAVYDFYLMRSGDFAKSTASAVNAPYPHFTLISSSKNVIIDDAHAVYPVQVAYSMGFSTGVRVNLTPATNMSARGNATLRGSVSAANFFRQGDYEATGGDFDKFVQYLPVVSLYDAKGGFAAAGVVLPPPSYIAQHDQEFDSTFAEGYTSFKTLLDGAGAYGYEIRGLAPSTCYTAVLTTPNYPSYQIKTCLGVSGTTTTVSVNMDTDVGAGATLQGTVTSTASVNLANAEVLLSGEGVDTARSVVTNSSGAYKFEGLPPGKVKVKVSLNDYASAEAETALVGSNIYTVDFSSDAGTGLIAAGGSITGTVYVRRVPDVKTKPDAVIVAYNDTYNGLNPTKPLPFIRTKTDSDGNYKLEGLLPGDTYKVFLKVQGKRTTTQSVLATAGVTTGIDFLMQPKPMDLELFAKKGTDAFEFTVLNPQDFKTGEARWSVSPYNPGASTVLNLQKLSSGKLFGTIPLSSLTSGITYVLRGSATNYSLATVSKEILFGTDFKGNSEQPIDDAILGDDNDDEGLGRKNNEASIDEGGSDPTALIFPTGAVLPVSTGAIPTCSFKSEGTDAVSAADKVALLGADAFAGNLYTVSMASVSVVEAKGFDLALAYDKNTVTDDEADTLVVARYNNTTSVWEEVTGAITPNKGKGTVSVRLKSLASVLAVRKGSVRPQFSTFNGREYVVRPLSGGSSSSAGTFALIRPSVAGNAFAGSKMKVFNYPNPFNLKDKAISNNNGAALPGTVNGTVIHVEVPAGNGGPGHVRIYTLAGELVKDIKVDFTAGAYNYVGWDGHNAGGQEVANGVYYGVVEMSGKSVKLKDATFKMAVIK